jgi:hypothetical protein
VLKITLREKGIELKGLGLHRPHGVSMEKFKTYPRDK